MSQLRDIHLGASARSTNVAMTEPARDRFLGRVRQALREGGRVGAPAEVPARGTVGYQGAGTDLVARFCQELTLAGGSPHQVADEESAAACVVQLLRQKETRSVLLGAGRIDVLALAERLAGAGMTAVPTSTLTNTDRDRFFAADAGVGGVDYLIAETGSVALLAKPSEPRSLSLLPPIYIAVAWRHQLLPDLFDLYDLALCRGLPPAPPPALPSCLSIITGPSKTGDIELKLVTGVHGPGEIHVVVITE